MSLPISLSKVALGFIPAPALAHITEQVWQRVKRRHPKLMENLARLDAATVYLKPSDIPQSFALMLGSTVSFYVISDAEMAVKEPDATVEGNLEALVDMLEGREDGDTLFFSRDIQISGNTEVIVGLRNTLDREEIDLFSEILSMFGPFAKPAGIAAHMADGVVQRIHAHIEDAHDRMHKKKDVA